jgi:two-component sensor histidine kinase
MATISAFEARSRNFRRSPEHLADFCQSRHQTKSALQRIICLILDEPVLSLTRAGRDAAEDLVRRIDISAAISDALFGLTHSPFPLPERITSLVDSLIALHADIEQSIALDLRITDGVAISLERESLILQIIHEIVLNALKHGMYMRLVGTITIEIRPARCGGLTMSICNDGWAMDPRLSRNEGLSIVWDLAAQEGGEVNLVARPAASFQIDFPAENSSHPQRITG